MDESGNPLVLPVCFAYDGCFIYSPIDKKPKRVSADKLKRVRNIINNPNISLVIDKYFEDWNELYYVIITGSAQVLNSGEEYDKALKILAEKYDQYRKMGLENLGFPVIKITPEKIISWGDL
ncbi:MAG: TIGR03668 family PPOX class F420-dependent oxidoreductase [Deltaproteobacteria bacterium]|nr:TIGR03668 family PPOX class F420-dependent oxidoreductase [Deltaproteobacteria bacterium]